MKDGAYVINLDDKQSKRTRQVSLFIDRNTAVFLDFFKIRYIPQDVLKKIKDDSITHSIFRLQSDDSIMCQFYYIAFIEYMIAGVFSEIFSPNRKFF